MNRQQKREAAKQEKLNKSRGHRMVLDKRVAARAYATTIARNMNDSHDYTKYLSEAWINLNAWADDKIEFHAFVRLTEFLATGYHLTAKMMEYAANAETEAVVEQLTPIFELSGDALKVTAERFVATGKYTPTTDEINSVTSAMHQMEEMLKACPVALVMRALRESSKEINRALLK